jgi:acyl-homoserine lactone acylase PvdQ
LRAGGVENEMIDYLLSGEMLKEVDHMKEPIENLDYSYVIQNTEVVTRKAKGRAHAFAVSGNHTDTGKPILVNSIEDQNRMPGRYYIAKLRWGEGKNKFEVTGATQPGMIFFISGSNGRFSWAWSRVNYDSIDLYKEDFSKGDNRSQWIKD